MKTHFFQDLAEFVLTKGNYDLGISLVTSFQLPVVKVMSRVVSGMIYATQYKEAEELITRSYSLVQQDEDWDQFLLACIRIFSDNGISTIENPPTHIPEGQSNIAFKLAESSLIRAEPNRIEAMIACGKLKSAYLLAVKANDRSKVKRILEEADLKGFTTEKRLCEKWLALSPES